MGITEKSHQAIFRHLGLMNQAYQADSCDVFVSFTSIEGGFCTYHLRNIRISQMVELKVQIRAAIAKHGGYDTSIVAGPVSPGQKQTP